MEFYNCVNNTKKSIIDRISIKIQKKFGKPKYGKRWPEKSPEWYKQIHDDNWLIHDDFKKYLKSKNDIKSVAEIGCGKGVYPLLNKELFNNLAYTGIDISPSAIEYCKKNSDFTFLTGDFIKMELDQKFDLIYSHAVVDHVYDIDAFISKIIDSTKKYAYINAYRGYFPDLTDHKMKWDGYEACYFNDLSVNRLKELFSKKRLNNQNYVIRSQKSGQKGENVSIQTVIEINKENY